MVNLYSSYLSFVKEPDIKTFEWPPFSMKTSSAARRESHFNGITAGTTTGEILLINTENRQTYEADSSRRPYMPYHIEKRLINERQKQRQCNCIAWNPVQENLLAAGYERSTKGEQKSCLLVWDIN